MANKDTNKNIGTEKSNIDKPDIGKPNIGKPNIGKPNIGKRSAGRPSEHIFRRSRAAENRRRIAQNKDNRFFRLVFGLASIGIFVVFIIILFMSKAVYGQEISPEVSPDAGQEAGNIAIPETTLTRPLIGDFSVLDLMGLAFVMVAGYAVYRKYRPPK